MEIGGIFRGLLCLQCGKLGLQLGQLFLRRFGASQQLRVLVSGYGSSGIAAQIHQTGIVDTAAMRALAAGMEKTA